MRLRLAALVALLVLAMLPVPTAQAVGWSVDATVAVTSATSADYTWTIGLATPTRLKLPLPDNATFVEARDVDGRRLDATADESDVTVTSGSKPFTIRFALEGQRDGPFSIFPAQVASAPDSPVRIAITLPPGWSLAGYRDSDDRAPDLTGAFSGTGPAYVQYLALAPGHVDDGPVPGVSGRVVHREGEAAIDAHAATWTLVTTYDTDVYSRSWEVHVPPGATVASATSPLGPLATTREGDILRVTTPYPVGYHLGARSFTVTMSLAPPALHGGTFREVNLSVRAAEDDRVRIRATLADGLSYTGARVAGGNETAPLQYEGTGPLSVGVAFLPPPAADHVRIDEGLFVVDAPRSLEAAARATARNASEVLPRVAWFAYDARDTRPFYVAYTEADVFGWEEGFYSNGLNTITIRAKTLDDAAGGRARLVPVGVLVHEATHGLIDRRLPDVPHELSFLHEGLARLAETHLEDLFPAEEVIERNGTSYSRHSARPSAERLQQFHTANKLFDVAWHAKAAPDEERGALYDYSGMVLHAFERRAPEGALVRALAHLNATTYTGDAQRDAQRVLDVFLRHAPGTDAPAFLYPGREAVGLTDAQFRACMAGLVAPPYPWEDVAAPPGGCPPTGYGPRDAALPPPPPAVETPATTPSPTPVVVTSAPRPVAPTTTTPTPPATTEDDLPPQPGAIGRDAEAGTINNVNIEVPTAPLALVLALVALAAIGRARRG